MPVIKIRWWCAIDDLWCCSPLMLFIHRLKHCLRRWDKWCFSRFLFLGLPSFPCTAMFPSIFPLCFYNTYLWSIILDFVNYFRWYLFVSRVLGQGLHPCNDFGHLISTSQRVLFWLYNNIVVKYEKKKRLLFEGDIVLVFVCKLCIYWASLKTKGPNVFESYKPLTGSMSNALFVQIHILAELMSYMNQGTEYHKHLCAHYRGAYKVGTMLSWLKKSQWIHELGYTDKFMTSGIHNSFWRFTSTSTLMLIRPTSLVMLFASTWFNEVSNMLGGRGTNGSVSAHVGIISSVEPIPTSNAVLSSMFDVRCAESVEVSRSWFRFHRWHLSFRLYQ